MPRKFRQALLKKATLHLSKSRHVGLAQLLHKVRVEYKVRTLACEGGPTIFRALPERGQVDQLNLTIPPYVFGGAGLSKDLYQRECIVRSPT